MHRIDQYPVTNRREIEWLLWFMTHGPNPMHPDFEEWSQMSIEQIWKIGDGQRNRWIETADALKLDLLFDVITHESSDESVNCSARILFDTWSELRPREFVDRFGPLLLTGGTDVRVRDKIYGAMVTSSGALEYGSGFIEGYVESISDPQQLNIMLLDSQEVEDRAIGARLEGIVRAKLEGHEG